MNLKQRVMEARKIVSRGVNETPREVYKGVEVIVDDNLCLAGFGMIPEHPSIGCCTFSNPSYGTKKVIICNSKFFELPIEVQHAGFEHELGHFALGHEGHTYPKLWKDLILGCGEYMKDEMAADAYAVSVVGKEPVIALLKSMTYRIDLKLNIAHRIRAIKAL